MAITDIKDVKTEMEVLSDVLDSKGNVLLKAGSTLSEVWIERLKRRGIAQIDVSDVSQEGDSPRKSSENGGIEPPYEDLQEHMKHIFAPVLNNHHMKPLARATYQFLKSRNS